MILPETPFDYPRYEGPGWYKIKLEPSEVRKITDFSEVVLVKEIGGVTFEAMVPGHTLGENDSWVPAQFAGRIGGKVVFYLPTGNDGRPTWRVPEEFAEQILVQ